MKQNLDINKLNEDGAGVIIIKTQAGVLWEEELNKKTSLRLN